MKRTVSIAAAILCLASALFAAEDWRGDNRIAGYIVDKNTGKPVPNAKISLRSQRGQKGGPDVTADANGRWAMLGLGPGGWDVDVSAPGYELRKTSFALAQGQRLPSMKIELEPVKVVEAAPQAEAPHEEVKIGGTTVSKEVADAVEAGNALVGQKKYKEAVAEYEKASAALPDFLPLKFALARAYWGAGDLRKALTAMDVVYKADTSNATNAQLYANMLLEDGQVEKGKQIIDTLPAGSVTADALMNTGIVLMNKKQPTAAIQYFTKAISVDEKSHLGYYYRGLATIQAGKAKQAKGDLEKVLALAPNSAEATECKEYLKSIK